VPAWADLSDPAAATAKCPWQLVGNPILVFGLIFAA